MTIPNAFPRVVILTGDRQSPPARRLTAALLAAGQAPAAIVIDPPRGGRPRHPEPPLARKYAIWLRQGMWRYAARKLRAGLARRWRARLGLEPPTLDMLAARAGVPLYEEENVNEGAGLERMRTLAPDVLVMMGCRILKAPLLATARLALNFHTGILPWYRGGDTIYWALRNGEPDKVGFSIHEGIEALDAGQVYYEERVAPRPGELLEDIFLRCCERAAPRFVELIERYARDGRLAGFELDLSEGKIYKTQDWRAHAELESELFGCPAFRRKEDRLKPGPPN